MPRQPIGCKTLVQVVGLLCPAVLSAACDETINLSQLGMNSTISCCRFPLCSAPSSSMWLSNSPWCLMWDAYCNVLTTRPVATKLATGMVGTFLGDMLAQLMQNLLATHSRATARSQGSSNGSTPRSLSPSGPFELDLSRTARLVGFSAMVGTPTAFVWFSLLDQVRNGACYHKQGYTVQTNHKQGFSVQARAWSPQTGHAWA